MLQGTGDSRSYARLPRREMSPPEVRLWQALRTGPDGLKFRRRHPSGPYVADFYRHAARLVFDVDGEAHARGDRPERDAARNRWFETRRLRAVRISAGEVLRDRDAVGRGIVASATADQE